MLNMKIDLLLQSDIAEILSCPSKNGGPYAAALHRANDENKVFIRRSAVQNCKKPDKKCDLGLFNTTMTTRPDDIIEGNLPKLNREKVLYDLCFGWPIMLKNAAV